MDLLLHIMGITTLVIKAIKLAAQILQRALVSASNVDRSIVIFCLFVAVQKSRMSSAQLYQNLVAFINY